MSGYVSIGGERVSSLRLRIPTRGPWWVDATFEADPDVSGRVTVAIGDAVLEGTVRPDRTGTRGLQRFAQVVAGGGGWGTLLEPKHYHNDAGVRTLEVCRAAAEEAGETLSEEDFAPEAATLGADFVRPLGPAARALEAAIGSASWWVDLEGVTHVGERPTREASGYSVLDEKPDEQLVELDVADLRDIFVGAILSEGLDEARTVRDLDIEASPEGLRVRAWCGGDGTAGRLAAAFRSAVGRASPLEGKLPFVYLYRFVDGGSKLRLQAVHNEPGLPVFLQYVRMMPGLPGMRLVDITPGAHCLVQFLAGDPRYPIVTGFAGPDDEGYAPSTLVLESTNAIRINSHLSAQDSVRGNAQNDALDTFIEALRTFFAAVKVACEASPSGTLDLTTINTALTTAKSDLDDALTFTLKLP